MGSARSSTRGSTRSCGRARRSLAKRATAATSLQDHQQDNLRDLDAAQKGLKSDEQSLEEMIQSLT